jgi:hypothetical protein
VRQAALCPAGRWTQVMIGPLTELPLHFLRMGLSGPVLGANLAFLYDALMMRRARHLLATAPQ